MRYITLAIAFLICTASDAQIIRAEPFYIAPEAAAPLANLLLDSFPGAAVAYSLRKLDKDYTGSAIRVRRSSDNTEQDIGFVNNYLDTASMKTFVGANNGFVVTWYNQADSSGVYGVRNLSQSTAGNQPQIMSSGAIVYENSKPAIDFAQKSLAIPYNYQLTNQSVFSIVNLDATITTTSAQTLWRSDSTTIDVMFLGSNTGCLSNERISWASSISGVSYAVGQTSTNIAAGNYIFNAIFATTPSTAIYQNGSTLSLTNANTGGACGGGFSATNFPRAFSRIGGDSSHTLGMDGQYFEFILYPSDESTNRTAIRDNINSFYSIY